MLTPKIVVALTLKVDIPFFDEEVGAPRRGQEAYMSGEV